MLADRYGSDKGSVGTSPHRYTNLYNLLFQGRREQVRNIIEIGLLRGGPEVGIDKSRFTGDLPSVRMWLDFFPNAVVHGFDVSDFSFFKDERFRFTRGDAGCAADLRRLVNTASPPDFVIDDGSHASFHQQLAFVTLFPHLAPGGLYIIEDLHWQSPEYEDVLPSTIKTRDLVANWLRTGTFPHQINVELASLPDLADQIEFALLINQPFVEQDLAKVAVFAKRV